MTFSQNVKSEICESKRFDNDCCRKAQLYGILFFSNIFSFTRFKLSTESVAVAKRIAALADAVCDSTLNITAAGVCESDQLYTVTAEDKDAERLFLDMGYGKETVSLRLNRANFECDSCIGAFISGAYLACGSITAPEKSYHLEFAGTHKSRADALHGLIEECDVTSNLIVRKSNYVVYMKDSESIEDMLNIMGAQNAAFDVMNVKIYKDIRNRINRAANCETANLAKALSAAAEQVAAIRKLQIRGLFDDLPENLRAAAQLRLENPDAPLAELVGMSDAPITKSGLNHRLKKLMELSK
ncbi:MAG: DNA-binding protein WhiA [Bacillota bacterium]|nr:DNA-binding protein WhiA [Bacillota bacterium]